MKRVMLFIVFTIFVISSKTFASYNQRVLIGQDGLAYSNPMIRVSTPAGLVFELSESSLTVNAPVIANNISAVGVEQHYAVYRDTKAPFAGGGTCTSGRWIPRDLTETFAEVGTSINRIHLASSTIRLATGTYLINGFAPAASVDLHQSRFFNLTRSTAAFIGTTEFTSSVITGGVQTDSKLFGVVTTTITANFEIQHRCQTTKATEGFGIANIMGEKSIFTTIEIRRIK